MYSKTEYYVFIISIMRLLVWKNINLSVFYAKECVTLHRKAIISTLKRVIL